MPVSKEALESAKAAVDELITTKNCGPISELSLADLVAS